MIETIEHFIKQATQKLTENDLIDLSGNFLYSSNKTLQKGKIYLLGTNPGSPQAFGDPSDTIGDYIKKIATKTENAYLDEPKGTAANTRLKNNVVKLLEGCELNVREVCASNLIFVRSKDVNEIKISFDELAEKCWQVHELLIRNYVQPKSLIVYGNSGKSPFGFLFNKHFKVFGSRPVVATFDSGHGKNQCKWFETKLMGNPLKVIGVPHLSRCGLSDEAILKVRTLVNQPS